MREREKEAEGLTRGGRLTRGGTLTVLPSSSPSLIPMREGVGGWERNAAGATRRAGMNDDGFAA